jgi:hypothetical protein
MITYENFVAYFKHLATIHVDIRHGLNGRDSFFTADIEELITGIRSSLNPDKFIMLLINYNLKINDREQHNDIMFFILKNAHPGNYEEHRQIKAEAEAIAKDIVIRISEDSQSDDIEMKKLWFGSMDTLKDLDIIHTSILAASDRYYGVQVSFNSKSCFGYCKRPDKFITDSGEGGE